MAGILVGDEKKDSFGERGGRDWTGLRRLVGGRFGEKALWQWTPAGGRRREGVASSLFSPPSSGAVSPTHQHNQAPFVISHACYQTWCHKF